MMLSTDASVAKENNDRVAGQYDIYFNIAVFEECDFICYVHFSILIRVLKIDDAESSNDVVSIYQLNWKKLFRI